MDKPFRHPLVPDENEALDIGRKGRRFREAHVRRVNADDVVVSGVSLADLVRRVQILEARQDPSTYQGGPST